MADTKTLYLEYAFVMLVMVVGLLASITLSWSYQHSSDADVRHRFERAAEDRTELLRKMLDDNKILLNTLTAFYRSDDDTVTPHEFTIFARQLLRDHPYLQAIEWTPRVAKAEKAEYIRKQSATRPRFSFTEKDAAGTLAAAKERDEYFPLYYVEPIDGNEEMLGYDLAADPDTAPVLRSARELRQAQSSGLFTQWRKIEGEENVLFAAPIFREKKAHDAKGEVAYEALEGFVVSIVSLPKMIERAVTLLKPVGLNIVIRDMSATGSDEALLLVRSTKLQRFTSAEILTELKAGTRPTSTTTFEVGGRKWQVSIMAGRGYFEPSLQFAALGILAAGVIFTGLLVFYMLSRIREHERISHEVEDRTQEVAKEKKRVEMILLSTHEGIMGIDSTGKITFTNPRATSLLGYSKRELVGQDHDKLILHSHTDSPTPQEESGAIAQVLLDGRVFSTSDNVFWKKDGKPLQVEYTASPVLEGDDVAGAVIIFHDITERKMFEQQLEFMARHDQMTGLANRGFFADNLKKALFAADQANKKVGVAYFDLNDFKPVNDKLGHAAGDLMLKAFAQKLKEAGGNHSGAARMGGDEFTLMVENLSSKEGCLKIIDQLLEGLKQPIDIAGQQIRITASIGIAFYPDDANTPDALVIAADGAMYRAKKDKKGSTKYAVYEAAQDANHKRRETDR